MVIVPRKLINILRDTKAPNARLGGNTENINTMNPAITTMALNKIARPV